MIDLELEDLTPPQLVIETLDELDEQERYPTWNGRSGKVSIAENCGTVIRNHQVTGYQTRCIEPGCQRPGGATREHQFHLRVSKGADGVFVGPDQEHYNALLRAGLIKGSQESLELLGRIALRMQVLGVAPESTCRNPNCGKDLRRTDGRPGFLAVCPHCASRNGLPELAVPSVTAVKKLWHRDLAGGQEAVSAREQDMLRAEEKLHRKAVAEGNQELVATNQRLAESNEKLAAAMVKIAQGGK